MKRMINHKSGAIYGIPSAKGITTEPKNVHGLRGMSDSEGDSGLGYISVWTATISFWKGSG